jgi:hypothetical protein
MGIPQSPDRPERKHRDASPPNPRERAFIPEPKPPDRHSGGEKPPEPDEKRIERFRER